MTAKQIKQPLNDGGPAFPQNGDSWDSIISVPQGMSLRDWFAAHAKITDDDFAETVEANDKIAGFVGPRTSIEDPIMWVRWCAAVEARIRYEKADAMIRERNRPSVLEGGKPCSNS